MRYIIRETRCFPNSQKIVPLSESGQPQDNNNSFTEYFPNDEAAKAKITRRGRTLVVK